MPIIAAVQGYDLNIGVGQAQAIDVAGDRVHFISATDPFAVIELRPNFSQGNISLKPGQGYRFAEQVTRWVVYNRGTVPLTGSLMIGTGDFFDQRISGTVDVIDGGKARTLGNQAFLATSYQGAVAAQYPHVQLWNPAGSGKQIIVEAFAAASATAGGWQLRSAVAALTTLGAVPASKKVGGASGIGQVRTVANAVAQGVDIMMQGYLQASTLYEKKLVEPIVLGPGTGINIMANALNVDITASFEYFEENA